MKRTIVTTFLALSAVAAATSAHAEIHTYDISGTHRHSVGGGSTTLTINTATGQGTIVGGNINATFRSNDFSSFAGGATPSNTIFDIENLQGSRVIGGNRLNVTDAAIADHPYRLIFDGDGNLNLWARWGGGNRYGDYLATTNGYTPPAPPPTTTSSGGFSSTGGVSSSSSSSSTGGTSTGGSSGGTDVPAPGALLLFGLGALGLAFGNRRRKNKL